MKLAMPDSYYLEPVIPLWFRGKNQFLRHEFRPFHTNIRGWGKGRHGTAKYAIYLDKNGNEKEEVAQVIWNKDVWHMEKQRFVPLRGWMRYCPDIVTRYVTEEMWNTIAAAERTDKSLETRQAVLKNVWGI